jgi:hypothetical protein
MSIGRSPRSLETNGCVSRGAVTEEGKARSSQNSKKDAILARRICLSAADEEIYCAVFKITKPLPTPRSGRIRPPRRDRRLQIQMRMQPSAALSVQNARDKNVVDSEWSATSDADRE